MSILRSRSARWGGKHWFAVLALAGLAVVCWTLPSQAEEGDGGVSITRIDEEWELVVANPDANSVGPQVTCAISPAGGVSGLHATFELNHQSTPSYSAGGLHLHLWTGESRHGSAHAPSRAVLNREGEVIRWRTSLAIWEDYLVAWVSHGDSTTWGNFGGETLALAVHTDLSNLNQYSPDVSAQQSGVAFGGNRVQSLKLLKVKARLSNGETREDNTVRVVHELE